MLRLPLAAVVALAATAAVANPASTTVELKNNTGETIGKATLTEAPKGVLMRVEAKGLTPGWHGLHFHEKADCSKPDFTSAGGHTMHHAGDRVHGLLNDKANETGDLPNLPATNKKTKFSHLLSKNRAVNTLPLNNSRSAAAMARCMVAGWPSSTRAMVGWRWASELGKSPPRGTTSCSSPPSGSPGSRRWSATTWPTSSAYTARRRTSPVS